MSCIIVSGCAESFFARTLYWGHCLGRNQATLLGTTTEIVRACPGSLNQDMKKAIEAMKTKEKADVGAEQLKAFQDTNGHCRQYSEWLTWYGHNHWNLHATGRCSILWSNTSRGTGNREPGSYWRACLGLRGWIAGNMQKRCAAHGQRIPCHFGNTTLWIRKGIQLVVSYRPTAHMNWTACFGAHIESAAVVIHHRACERFYKLNEFQISPTAQHLHRDQTSLQIVFTKIAIASLAHHVIIADLLYDMIDVLTQAKNRKVSNNMPSQSANYFVPSPWSGRRDGKKPLQWAAEENARATRFELSISFGIWFCVCVWRMYFSTHVKISFSIYVFYI